MRSTPDVPDVDFLTIVAEEHKNSIGFGFEHDGELSAERTTALNFYKGDMSATLPPPPNRSAAVSSDVADAIETALADLVEVFVAGDDVATFEPEGPEDEETAKQETEFVLRTVVDKNDGFLLFYTGIKDALQVKLGVFKACWVDESTTETTEHSVPAEAWPVVHQTAEDQGFELEDVEEGPDAVSFKLTQTKRAGRVQIDAFPPEDFAYASDTVKLNAATYCAVRTRPRAQTLIEDGYDADDVSRLPAYGIDSNQAEQQARDTARESDRQINGAVQELRQVEIVEHYIRIDADGDGKTELWRVVTGGGDTILLKAEEVAQIPFAVLTPYLVTHRLTGRSLADLLIEIQSIKTVLLRSLLDSGYFALNQRFEVATATGKANKWTLSDLLKNEPGRPVRSEDGQSVRALGSPGLSFQVTDALEYISTMAEQRTGVTRNANGLNPDTLHDTAGGMRQLIGAAQKRIRMVARVFAETGVRDLFLIVHALLREHGGQVQERLGGQWTTVDPSTWPERTGMKVQIGIGSGGREHDIAAGQQLLAMQAQAVQAQGGVEGPLVGAEHINAAAKRVTERLGFRNPDQFWRDPKTWKAPDAAGPPPQVAAAQIDAQAKVQAAQVKAKTDLELGNQRLQLEDARERDQAAAELELKQREILGQFQLKGAQISTDAKLRVADLHHKHTQPTTPTGGGSVHVGGEPG